MGQLLLLLLVLNVSGSLCIFHRWYIPQTNVYSKIQNKVQHADWRGRFQKRQGFLALSEHVIEDCMTVSHSETGSFTYIADGQSGVCGLYLVGRPDEKIEIILERVDLEDDCSKDVLVIVDGWELNGHVVPSSDDHLLPLNKRFIEVCGRDKEGISLVSSQNSAMVQFKIGSKGAGFKVSIKYIHNPDPCNVLMSDMAGVFIISNNGQERNCSVTTLLFPAKISLLEVNVGQRFRKRTLKRQYMDFGGLVPQCSELGEKDFLELGGSEDLSTNLQTKSTLCGYEPRPVQKDLTILCGSTTVRLVSSGEYRNTVTALVQEAKEEDLDLGKNIIMACPEFSI